MKSLFEKIKTKYKAMAAPLKAVFWFTICSFIQRGISMITTPVFTRLLSAEEYGLYSTYLSWETVILMLVTLSLYKAMMNLYIKNNEYKQILAQVCGLEFTLSLIWLIVGLVFRDSISELFGIPSELVCCLFVYCIFQAVFQCWFIYKRYIYDYKSLVIVTLIMMAFSSLLGVFAVAFISATAVSRVFCSVGVTAIIGMILYGKIFWENKTFYDRKVWRFSLGFCIPLLPHYLSEFVLQSSDKIMINYMCSSSDVASYSIAYTIGTLINLVSNTLNSTFAPYQYQKIKAQEYDALAKRTNQVFLLIGIILIGIMLFGREIVLVFGGYKYIDSVSMIIPICLGIYFNYMFQVFARVQEYYERKISVVIPSVLCAFLNLILNYVFIGAYGYQAAAYTTFVCYLLFCIMHYFFYRKVCREILNGENLYNIRELIRISVFVISAGTAVSLVNRILWLKYSVFIVMMVVMFFLRKKLFEYIKEIISK